MRAKILFMVISMNVGGTEKALLNMLSIIPRNKFDITLLMLEEYGGLLNSIPQGVTIQYLNEYKNIKSILNNPPLITIFELLKGRKIVKAAIFFFLILISKALQDRSLLYKYVLHKYPGMNNEFDVAVAYAGPMDFISYFIIKKVKAKKKIQWIHFDISKIGFNRKFASRIYSKFDRIFVVSNEGRNKLLNILPNLQEKTEVFFNIISSDSIKEKSCEGIGFNDQFKGIRILTVGRLSKEKGQDLTIPVLARLKKEGYNIRWYCIGEGSARKEYEKLIKMYDVENDYILLGANANPYPFMKQCGIYVQSSRHEGFCITLSEARCFDNPIISTNFTGANEQIVNNQTGFIVNCEQDQIYETIKRLLTDIKLKNKIKGNLQNEIIDTTKEILKLYKFTDIC
ncbi:glycosyltransferase [Neobacillus sp. PS3-40]|uniref:glycosyltransferase n=1 Tax=Neobacillus sp. PS3-40 TaxID=3070679 RepID=UPI0027E1BB4C|nr:glycosyltransferase [Neobacillus sp. PS3-40]WML45810.1 glycosyltransferase [Neobacillus sp. PS3-40]